MQGHCYDHQDLCMQERLTKGADVAEPQPPIWARLDAVAGHVHADAAGIALQHLVLCCVIMLPAHLQEQHMRCSQGRPRHNADWMSMLGAVSMMVILTLQQHLSSR